MSQSQRLSWLFRTKNNNKKDAFRADWKIEAANDEHLRAVKQTDRQQRAACLTNIKEHTAGKIHPHPALLPSQMAHFQF